MVRVSVFCGQAPDDTGSWGFADDLRRAEIEAIAVNLVKAQLITYRRLFHVGTCMHVRLDVGAREQAAFKQANQDVARELAQRIPRLQGVEREIAETDLWILKNFVYFFAVSVDRLLASTLGSNSHAVRMQLKRAAQRRAMLSEAALGELAA